VKLKKKSYQTRVVHLLYSGLGGHSAVLFSLIEGGFMKNSDHHIFFVGVEYPSVHYISRCESLNINWSYESKTSGKNRLGFIISIFRKLNSLKADILFLHGLAALPSIIFLRIFTQWGKRPLVLIRETQANHLKSRKEWILLALAHVFANNIVHLTKEAADGACNYLRWFYNARKVSVIPNGLNTNYFRPRNNRRKDTSVIRIGMQSRLQSNKDHMTLIAAFVLVCRKMPSTQFELHIAGDGDTREFIEKKAKQLELGDRVIMHGMLGQADLQKFLNGLDIYAHCTYGETMSTAIMQALASGLPIIASDVDGVNNMINSSVGFLYQPGDEYDLAKKIGCLIDDPAQAMNLGLGAREFAVTNYGIDVAVDSYEKLLSLQDVVN
jgi:glycosyltransferase involved in cell wall biosynthesis